MRILSSMESNIRGIIWTTPFEFHTPPVEDFRKHIPQGEFEFQIDNSFGTSKKKKINK